MSKKSFISLALSVLFAVSAGVAFADVQSPVYNDNIGRSHFMSRGGYSKAQKVQSNIESSAKKSEKQVSNIKNDTESTYRETFTYKEDNKFDYNPYTGAEQGVNDSKSIYTDGLGRLHFFGRDNIIRY